MTLNKLLNTLSAGRVKRWHTSDGATQSVGEHTFGVCVILIYLLSASKLDAQNQLATLVGGLLHDAPEIYTGDIPAPIRKQLEDAGAMSLIDATAREKVLAIDLPDALKRIVFYADKLEAFLFALKTGRDEIAEFNKLEILQTIDTDTETERDVVAMVKSFFERRQS